jgi:hypothetical protein
LGIGSTKGRPETGPDFGDNLKKVRVANAERRLFHRLQRTLVHH